MSNDLARGLKELANSRPAYEEAEGYYSGSVKEYFSNRAIENALSGQGSKRFRLPLAAKAVDIPIDMLEVIAVTATGGDVVTEALRTRIWDHNDLDADLVEAFRGSAKLGDFYVTIWPETEEDATDDDTEDGEDAMVDGARYVEVFLNSPLTMRAVYSRENSRRCLFFIKVWRSDEDDAQGNPRWRVNLYYRDRIEQWVSVKGSKGIPSDAKDFEPHGDTDEGSDESWSIENEYGRFPCFHFRQGGKPYGVPLHQRAYGPQDALTKMNGTMMSTVDFIGYPQRYALVDADAEDDSADDDFYEFETSGVANVSDPTSHVNVTKKKSRLKSGPGETWWLEGVKEVGQFETADSAPFIEGMKFQAKAMALLTDLDRSDFDLDGSGQAPSGESRRIARAGLHAKVRSLIGQYKPVAESMLEFALEMIGYPDQKVSLTFAPLDTMTGLDDWAMIEKKVSTGVPLRVALSEAGYADEKIEEWYPDDEPAVSLGQAKDVAAVLASLGQAVSLGSASNADVLALLRQFLPQGRPEPTRPALDAADLDEADDETEV